MRSSVPAIPVLVLLLFSSVHVAADTQALRGRDQPAASTTVTPSPASTSSNQDAARSSDTHAASSDPASPTASPNASAFSSNTSNSTLSTAAATSALPTTTSSLANSTASNSTAMAPADVLPLMPEVTPALSVAGVFLMISGITYCLIGIKNKWIQIFISASYLTTLAILSLILYVMNPPITNAIQGAYLAATVAPAILLGTGALIFRDVTEGLGCAIGGFALSMFFLVLKPGGTIQSQAGVAIFIGCWTAVSFCLSFSHYTRSYGIIGSSAIGGATATVLGIDCFSRAGLKEFWVYIWNLNGNLFPLLQDTYPITRGIRVEIAGIVVFTFFGILSQLKIWKVIQARRERKEQELLEANRDRDEEEVRIGQDVEAGNQRDRGNWETIYGDKDPHADSGIGTDAGSTRKSSVSIGKSDEVIEMDQLTSNISPSATSREHDGPMVIRVAQDEYTPGSDIASQTGTEKGGAHSPTSAFAPKDALVVRSEPAHTASPKVVPLPFKLPKEQKAVDDVASNATFNDSERSPRYSQRFSGMHLMRKTSNKSKRASIQTSSSVEALVDTSARDESDRSGSFSSRSRTPTMDEKTSPPEIFMTPFENGPSFEDSVRENLHSVANATETPVASVASVLVAGNKVEEKDTPSGNESEDTEKGPASVRSKKSTKSRTSTKGQAAVTSLKSHLPDEASKVVLQYRTNEWAKHLSVADQPEIETIPVPEAAIDEQATSVNARELLQTALTAEPKPAPLPSKRPTLSVRPPLSRNGLSSSPSPPQSSTTVDRSHSPMHSGQTRQPRRVLSNLRSTSSPLLSTPIDEDEASTFHTPLPNPADTLLAHRNTLLQHKHLTGSSAPSSRPDSAHSNLAQSPLSHSTSSLSLLSSTSSDPEDDNAPLSLRKSHLQRLPSNPSITPLPSAANADPALRRATMLAAWRQSIAAEVSRARDPEAEVQAKREEMWAQRLAEKEEMEHKKSQAGGWGADMDRSASRASSKGSRDSRRMSGREVNNAHREVLRRMQAGANRKLMENGG